MKSYFAKFSISLLLICLGCEFSNAQKNNAKKMFEEKVSIIEDNLDDKTIDGFSDAVTSIEHITGILSFKETEYTDFKIPNRFNLEDWKSWLDLNKNGLNYDAKKDEFYLNGERQYIEKKPINEFNKYLTILRENGIESKDINLNELNYALSFFEELTSYNQFEYNSEYEEIVPKIKDINFLENWLDEHRTSLKWNKEKHKLEL